MEIAAAVQNFWENEKDAIVRPNNVTEADYSPDKSRFDPRKWMIKGENAIQKAVEDLVIISNSANKSILV